MAKRRIREKLGAKTAPWPVAAPRPVISGTTVLEVRDLGKTFRSGFLRRKQRGISGVSFQVPQGSVFAILGHNGAGKTTTLNCILDLIHPDQGEVRIFERDHQDSKARSGLGYLPERPYFFEHLTGRELLAFYADLLGIPAKAQEEEIDRALQRTGMEASAGRRLKKYSKGMLQRIGLAQALLGDPQLLILDEPMSGLDPVGRREVRDLLRELKAQGKTIILSSHIVPDVEMLADSVGILNEGQMVLVRDLAAGGEETGYAVKIRSSHPEGSLTEVTADSASSLRETLNRCHEDGLEVLSVQPCTSGLEEMFLSAVGHRGGSA
jgi:ABC-2 type transport system ATP-binding protein